MSETDKEGNYCAVCGGISPSKVTTKRILVNGKEVGIDKLDQIVGEVKALNLQNDASITEELLKRTRAINYIPTARSKDYGEALFKEYKRKEGH